MNVVNDYVNHVFNAVMEHASELCEVNKKSTLTSREVQTGVRLSLPGFFPPFFLFSFFLFSFSSSSSSSSSSPSHTIAGELAKHAVSEGTKAVTKFHASSYGGGSNRRMTKSAKAGLQFPVGKILTLMKSVHGGRVGQGAPVYLAAVMEYMVFFFFFFPSLCLHPSDSFLFGN